MRWLSTRPARSSTWRCLVTACRVMAASADSLAIERGRPSLSLISSDRRVGSPRAAKTSAGRPWPGSSSAFDIGLDVLNLLGPAAVVHAQGVGLAVRGQGVETGFGDHQAGSLRGGLQAELDQGRGLAGIVDLGIDGVGV